MKQIIQDLNLTELEELMRGMGEKPFRAKQLYSGIMRGHNLSDVPAVPAALLARLGERFEDCPLEIIKTLRSSDGTEKYLYRLADGNIIEGVFMQYKYGNTLCVSTQVGCRMGCKFCASTLGGLVRNLTSGEILSQILKVNALHGGTPAKRAVTNVVLMGSGEPLTVSLHNVTDEERARTMPIAKRYKISEILDACSNYFRKTGRRYIFEYSLIEGENSDERHADALIALLKGRPCHVNLIRLNDVKERNLAAASERGAQEFLKRLTDGGISATLRRRMGADIGGACGQLRAGYIKDCEQ